MKIKKVLLYSLAVLSLVACSNLNSTSGATDEEREALKILEEKREYYQKLDKEKAKEIEKQEQITETNTTEEDITKKPADTTEEIKTEKEKLANMTPDERLIYRVDKAKEKIDSMLETAKKARQEELDVEETKAKVEDAIKNITGETAPETATIIEEAK
ncbi:hypothetical protein O3799_04050 [Fusobacterium periodonticum]|jgi:hypothetical protein|uniref:hypothetical protein n=1 Tax=Fusobacterium periodonticum TaxID=860 RepID=UPI001956CFA1|nr:hypothetical protein [Fusobacterium periodonticum]VTX79142.1 Uncharacterised protein [Fusobacterium periodonticum]